LPEGAAAGEARGPRELVRRHHHAPRAARGLNHNAPRARAAARPGVDIPSGRPRGGTCGGGSGRLAEGVTRRRHAAAPGIRVRRAAARDGPRGRSPEEAATAARDRGLERPAAAAAARRRPARGRGHADVPRPHRPLHARGLRAGFHPARRRAVASRARAVASPVPRRSRGAPARGDRGNPVSPDAAAPGGPRGLVASDPGADGPEGARGRGVLEAAPEVCVAGPWEGVTGQEGRGGWRICDERGRRASRKASIQGVYVCVCARNRWVRAAVQELAICAYLGGIPRLPLWMRCCRRSSAGCRGP
jgi:hypothetical protein